MILCFDSEIFANPLDKQISALAYSFQMINSDRHCYSVSRISLRLFYDIFPGKELPVPLFEAAVVPFEETFLIIGGGYIENGWVHSDKVYKYTAEGDWQEMQSMKLSEAKRNVTAMIVPSSLFD